jgi:hypothetical protein
MNLSQRFDGAITSKVLKMLQKEKPVIFHALVLVCNRMLLTFKAVIFGSHVPASGQHLVALAVCIGGVVLRDLQSMLRAQSKLLTESFRFRRTS